MAVHLQVKIGRVPGAVQRERAHAAEMADGKVHADGGADRDARDVGVSIPVAPRKAATWLA